MFSSRGEKGFRFVIVLGIVLLVAGFLAKISVLWTVGLILLAVGAVLAVFGRTGNKIAGREHWY